MMRTAYLSILSILACAALIFSLSTVLDLDAAPLMMAGIITGLVVTVVNIVTNIMKPIDRSGDHTK